MQWGRKIIINKEKSIALLLFGSISHFNISLVLNRAVNKHSMTFCLTLYSNKTSNITVDRNMGVVKSVLGNQSGSWNSRVPSSWLPAPIISWWRTVILVLCYIQPFWWQHEHAETLLPSASTFRAGIFFYSRLKIGKSLKETNGTDKWKFNTNSSWLCCACMVLNSPSYSHFHSNKIWYRRDS